MTRHPEEAFWLDFLQEMPEPEAVELLREFKVNFHVGGVLIRNYDPQRLSFKIDNATGRIQKGSVHFG